jgi:hypothetical protein
MTFVCRGDRFTEDTPYEHYLNVSNANFRVLMETLDLPAADEYGACPCGTWEGSLLLAVKARVAAALAFTEACPDLDQGRPPSESRGLAGCRVIDCGMPPGYLAGRLEHLLGVIDRAISLGTAVTYG